MSEGTLVDTPSDPPGPHDFGAVAAALDVLDRLSCDIRRELANVRREMAREAARYGDYRFEQLQEANEHLVQAALQADQRAEEASAALNEAAQSSQFDALTETPNRLLMRDRLGKALAMARRHDTCLALLFLDLDSFKQINDSSGHAAGDEVLKQVAARLQSAVRESDTVSRRGGDEFLVLVPQVANREGAARIARKILDAVAAPMNLDGRSLSISASVGIALRPHDGDDAATLIARADEAMYEAKRGGRNTYRFSGDSDGAQEATVHEPALSARDALVRNLREVNEHLLTTALRAQELLDAAEIARDRLTQALAVLAHELRNPLAPIRSAGQWLSAAHAGDPALTNTGNVINRQVAQMTRLIDDLLNSARTSAIGFRLQRTTLPLRDVLQSSIEASRSAMLARRQELSVRLPEPTVLVDGDPMRLEQVFSNLLDNASKYTHLEGHIALAVEDADDWVTVTVSDDGMGITPEALPKIFDLFMQEARTLDRDVGGLGVGLAVVRELVLAHGGTIEAHSLGPGKGSEFKVRLPRGGGLQGNCAPQ